MGVLDPLMWGLGEERSRVTRGGRMAAIAFIAAGLAAIPANLVLEPSNGLVYLMPLLSIVPGVACLLIPWQRMPEWALHAISVIGIALISLSMALASPAYAVFYVFIALFVALILPDVRVVFGHWILITVGLFVPVVVGSFTGRETLVIAILMAPTLLLVTAITAYLTSRLESSREALWALARQDWLTGVGNYRALHERLEAEIASHSRSGREFALILLDLDTFKLVNDRFGHLGGDGVLAQVGQSLRDGVRGGDSVFRQGGDEFSVVAPETELAEAEEVVARLRVRIRECGIRDHRVSASAGIAVYPSDGHTVDDLLGYADVHLLGAKHGAGEGREAEEPT